MKTLIINPGSTTTKLAVFDDQVLVFEHKIDHSQDLEFQQKFSRPGNVIDQFEDRTKAIEKILKENNVTSLDAVIGRGGMLPPIPSGTYTINDKMIDDLKNRPQGNHASNLGAPIAKKIARDFNIPDNAFIVDPVTTDEIEAKHKITGIPEIKRYAGWHALNQKAVAREYAKSIDKKYDDLNLIVAHLGGGASFGAHKHGKTVNVLNAISGEGPFTPERAGNIPAQSLIELCFSNKYTKEELLHLITGGGGLYAHLGTKDLKDLELKYPTLSIEQKDVVDEMLAGISRSICSLIPDFEGEQIDQILLTGGVVRWPLVPQSIKRDLSALNIGLTVFPGEFELEALRDGALRVLNGQELAKEY